MTDDVSNSVDPIYSAAIEAKRALWESTGNPLYVWQAINYCFSMHYVPALQRAGQMPDAPFSRSDPMPDWCLAYLGTTAARLQILADGKDFRGFPAPIGNALTGKEAWSAAWKQKGDNTVDDMTNLVLWALGIKRKGGNAFRDLRSQTKKERDYWNWIGSKAGYRRAADAISEHLEVAGITDESIARKRIRAVEKAYGVGRRPRGRSKPPP